MLLGIVNLLPRTEVSVVAGAAAAGSITAECQSDTVKVGETVFCSITVQVRPNPDGRLSPYLD